MTTTNSNPRPAVTADSIDPIFNDPFIEVNELRTDPVPHRYVHGGFKGTDARFSFYFPPKEQYRGRFHHNTYPMALHSDIGPFPIQFEVAMGNLGFTLASGAYYVQTNNGGTFRTPGSHAADPAIAGYRANAAAAKYSRIVAAELYGEHRPHGYLFGGSGGSYQVMGAAHNTVGVWDGFLPYVLGTAYGIPSMFTVRMHALRVLRLRNRLPGIADAMAPGGSGDPYAGLNEEEAAALREATLLGFPLRSWYNHEELTSGYFPNVSGIVPAVDSTYLEDFWTKPGYLGADPNSSIRAARVQFDTTVASVTEGPPRRVTLATVPGKDFSDSHIIMLDGPLAGRSATLEKINDETVMFSYSADHEVVRALKPGDRVRIDNSWALAQQTYQHHQLPPTPDIYGFNQFRDPKGEAIYPQRGILTGPLGAVATSGSMLSGAIHGKTLVLEAVMDIDALPWGADWYRGAVKDALGADFKDNFVLWYIDYAQHENPQTAKQRANTVSYGGALQQGLRDLAAWVEKGVRPSDTRYKVVDTQIELPASAAERGGIQPVVELQANGGVRAEVAVGEPVEFAAIIEVPPGAGKVVAAEWDFENTGDYPVVADALEPRERIELSATHAYTRPGTYFPVLRATSQRQGDANTAYGRVQNLARARVVVT